MRTGLALRLSNNAKSPGAPRRKVNPDPVNGQIEKALLAVKDGQGKASEQCHNGGGNSSFLVEVGEEKLPIQNQMEETSRYECQAEPFMQVADDGIVDVKKHEDSGNRNDDKGNRGYRTYPGSAGRRIRAVHFLNFLPFLFQKPQCQAHVSGD
jgi:hypothetical protein